MSASALPDFLAFQHEFTQHLRAPRQHPRPAGVDARRMRVYQELVYANIESFLLQCFPVLRQTVGARKWRQLMQGFVSQHFCSSPLFRDIPRAFVTYLQSDAWPDAAATLFWRELAHYEWIELALATALAPPIPALNTDGDLGHDRPYLNPVHALLTYTYPVHLIGGRRRPKARPASPTYLLVFRHASFEVKFIVLNALTARLIALIQTKRVTGHSALHRIARELKHDDPPALRTQGLQLLQDLRATGAILGTR